MKTKLHLLLIAMLFSFNSFGFTPVTITGGGVGGWNMPGSVAMTTTDGIIYTKIGMQLSGDLNIKFAINNSWGTTGGFLGASGWPSGTASLVGTGANIVGVAGFWDVTFNITTGDYTFVAGVDPNRKVNFTGGGLGADISLSTLDGINFSKESVTFPALGGNGKFYEIVSPINPTPTAQWSSIDFPGGVGTQTGDLIPIPEGTFYLFLDITTGEYNFADTTVSIVGGWIGWNTGDLTTVFTSTDNIHYSLASLVIPAGGTDLEFIDNHSWTFEFPTSDPTGTALVGTAIRKGTGTSSNIHVPAGTYNVTFNRSTLAYSFTNALAVNKFDANKFSVYPNPTKNSWNFTSGNSDITSVKIVDMLGKTVMSKKSAAKEVSVDASSLSKGMYFAEITSGDSVQTVKVVRD